MKMLYTFPLYPKRMSSTHIRKLIYITNTLYTVKLIECLRCARQCFNDKDTVVHKTKTPTPVEITFFSSFIEV